MKIRTLSGALVIILEYLKIIRMKWDQWLKTILIICGWICSFWRLHSIYYLHTFELILLFISYKFVKGFFAITFLLLVISSWNSYDVCQCFLYGQKPNFSWIRQKMRNFPIGKIFVFCRIKLKFCSWLKNVDTHHESFS